MVTFNHNVFHLSIATIRKIHTYMILTKRLMKTLRIFNKKTFDFCGRTCENIANKKKGCDEDGQATRECREPADGASWQNGATRPITSEPKC